MILNTHPDNRKEMVKTICELTGMNATYLFTPTYAYQVGPITVNRDGSIVCEGEAMLSTIKPMLIARGWLEAGTQDEMPVATESAADFKDMPETVETIGVEQMDVTMPIPGWTVALMINFLRMLCSKQVLISRMIGCNILSIEESFVQAISENPPESTADLEARVQEAIDAGSICGFRFSDGQVTLSTPFAQDEPTRWLAYTRRRLLTVGNDTPEAALVRSVRISDALQSVVINLRTRPAFVIAKGGITSSDVGTKVLGVKRAKVLGQIRPGIPVWQTGEESRFPGVAYVIFPENVDETGTLAEAAEILLGKPDTVFRQK